MRVCDRPPLLTSNERDAETGNDYFGEASHDVSEFRSRRQVTGNRVFEQIQNSRGKRKAGIIPINHSEIIEGTMPARIPQMPVCLLDK